MSQSQENKELNELVSKCKSRTGRGRPRAVPMENEKCDEEMPQPAAGKLTQWTTGDGKRFIPAGDTRAKLPPGFYEIHTSANIGIFFEKILAKTEGLLRFPQTNLEKVVREIEKFWERENIFKEYGIPHKRGVILWGPAGSGKSSCIQLIIRDVIERDGVCIKFTNPGLFMEGMRLLREVQSDTPVIVLMEDIDSTIEVYSESEVLNILDGVDQIKRVVFLATTNYPERLGARIINRPSRFDKRFKIGHPNVESRTMYFKHLCAAKKPEDLGIDIKKWVKDTDGFSIAHLKELFVAVIIFGDEYAEALENLSSMKETISSEDDSEKMMGFGAHKQYAE